MIKKMPNDDTHQTFLAHFGELKKRVLVSVAVLFVIGVVAWIYADPILAILIEPLKNAMMDLGGTDRLIMTSLTEGFVTRMRVALFTAFFVSLPFILYQIWAFMAPGLYKKERSILTPLLIASPIMFVLGACFVYYLVIPNAWAFFLGFQSSSMETALKVQSEVRLGAYLDLIMSFLFAFGVVFQWPILLILLGKVGVVSVASLQKMRRIVIVLSFVLAAFLTPPDIISQLALALPMIVFYEIAIVILRLMKTDKTS